MGGEGARHARHQEPAGLQGRPARTGRERGADGLCRRDANGIPHCQPCAAATGFRRGRPRADCRQDQRPAVGAGDARRRYKGHAGRNFRAAASQRRMDTAMSFETILVEQKGAVTLVTLNRPQALNALNSQVLAELVEAFRAYEADESQRCLVLTGSGDKAFAAGADIKEMAEKPAADFYLQDFFSDWQTGVVAARKPWIAAVNGYALGGGCEVAMM